MSRKLYCRSVARIRIIVWSSTMKIPDCVPLELKTVQNIRLIHRFLAHFISIGMDGILVHNPFHRENIFVICALHKLADIEVSVWRYFSVCPHGRQFGKINLFHIFCCLPELRNRGCDLQINMNELPNQRICKVLGMRS